MTVRVLVLVMFLLAPVGIVAAASGRPSWCQPGWECVPTQEMMEDTIYHIDLREKIAKAEARGGRFGFSLGCGLGVAGVVADDWSAQAAPAGFCGVMYGVRF